MVNEEILGGLKLALSKGESLKRAMNTFYNAGYKREEIEEAARIVQQQPVEKKEPEKPKVQSKKIQKPLSRGKPIQKVSSYGNAKPEQVDFSKQLKETKPQPKKEITKPAPQKVSGYEEKPKPKPKLIIILLIFFFLLLVGAVVTIFLFKQEIIDFLNKIY